jgi:hypothetical protein
MGTIQSDQITSFLNKYTFKRVLNHPELGEVKIFDMKYKKGFYILLYEITFQTNEEMEIFR